MGRSESVQAVDLSPSAVDVARELDGVVAGEVLADRATRAAYSSDASNHRVVPRVVVRVRDADDVAATIDWCRSNGVALTPRGGGTSVAGNAIGPGVVIDHSHSHRDLISVDPARRIARVEPGLVLDDLQAALWPHGLRFAPDPSTHSRCTIGGMIGNNACGIHSVAWGTTADNVDALDVVSGAGERLTLTTAGELPEALAGVVARHGRAIDEQLGRFPRQLSGYALQHLAESDLARAFVGTEGTCGVVTAADLKLVGIPAHTRLVVAGFADMDRAAAAAPVLAESGALTVEGFDEALVAAAHQSARTAPALPAGRAWLFLEVGAPTAGDVEASVRRVAAVATDSGAVSTERIADRSHAAAIWKIRADGAGLATRGVGGVEAWPGWEDAAVPVDRLAGYVSEFRDLMAEYGVVGPLYGHFGEGCIHVRISHDLRTEAGRRRYREFQRDAAGLVHRHGGSPSGEHGDGRARSELLADIYPGGIIEAFGAYKAHYDPAGICNPGVLVDPVPLDDSLRLRLNREHTAVTDRLGFRYPDDGGDLGGAMRRCVGVGACRKESGGGMCPSYRATRDERHSTRGRARILFEMLDGDLADDGWRSDDVRDALDLCLACKACSNECPVSVDMATYKAEFLHQHYRRRLRPITHFSLGWLPVWLRAARRFPGVANRVMNAGFVKQLGGIDIERALPEIAAAPGVAPDAGPVDGIPVTLWVDTFTGSFEPAVVDAARELLIATGHRVYEIGPDLCCGLTWISTGQLSVARRVLGRTVARLSDAPGDIVALEPSCAAALRADAVGLLDTERSRAVARRVRTLAEALLPHVARLRPAEAEREDIVAQFHCHQRAVLGTDADRELLDALGFDVTSVDEGCCGLAGNFGFEPGHRDTSRACAEQSFVPVLGAHPGERVLADGVSCRLQVAEYGDRQPIHLAVLAAERLPAGRHRT